MICPLCGTPYREGFKICADCKVALMDGGEDGTLGLHSAEPGTIGEVEVLGKKLTCPVCETQTFLSAQFMLNTRMKTFLKFDWMDPMATAKICTKCHYIFWFAKT